MSKELEKAINKIQDGEDVGLVLIEYAAQSQTIKTVNPHGYIVNGHFVWFDDMKGKTISEEDEVLPLYTVQLTDK